MQNLWDRPPLPTKADTDIELVYAGIGRVTSEWEGIEVQLCRIYSFFVGQPDNVTVMHEYGVGSIFANRFGALKGKAELFFCTYPNQEIEAEFDRLSTIITCLSSLRNDVAHGVVQVMQHYEFFKALAGPLPQGNHYALVPPHHKWRGHNLQAVPKYAYASAELRDIAARINNVYGQLTRFRESVRALMHRP